jgi:hypothetical protein
MQTMVEQSLGGDRYVVQVRGHELIVDQPVDASGTGLGPTPVELFFANLASCVAHYAGSYLARHHICRDGLQVDTSWKTAETGRPESLPSHSASLRHLRCRQSGSRPARGVQGLHGPENPRTGSRRGHRALRREGRYPCVAAERLAGL